MIVTNTLAYNDTITIMAIKSLILADNFSKEILLKEKAQYG